MRPLYQFIVGDVGIPHKTQHFNGADKVQVMADDGTIRFMCGCCGKTFRHRQHLSRHQWKCLHKRSFVCSECHGTFFRPDKLKEHMQRHMAADLSALKSKELCPKPETTD